MVALIPSITLANPEKGTIAVGDITIKQEAKTTQITQTSDKAIIDWAKFNVSADELVRIEMRQLLTV
jgi:large exoprotein involved in heme utilization and adhesion